jgi:phosphoribosylglycinamide formyltransferase
VMEAKPDIIVLAGFMHICGVAFFKGVGEEMPVLNIHPALPGEFVGAMNAIQLAYEAFQRGEITKTGINVHRAIVEVDQGETVICKEVDMIQGESFESFEERMHRTEWELIVKATAKVLDVV